MDNVKQESRRLTRRNWLKLAAGGAAATPLFGQGHYELPPLPGSPHAFSTEASAFKRVTLEMSLKPFRNVAPAAIRAVCEHVFRQWATLLHRADACAVMLWTADGSEILDYRGDMKGEIEWGRYIGSANPPTLPPPGDQSKVSIHDHARLYIENPARITYGILKEIVTTLRSVGRAMTGKAVEVGATFDPGPEFARSPFKYERHTEILKGIWVDCTASLRADPTAYAGYPRGIPPHTPVGTFFGRQAQQFLTDLGFDYIWFSNGFGFSATAWSVKGPIFDGTAFHPEHAAELREKVLAFWKAFRRECPHFRIETRGSNLSTGADLSASASPLREIYDGGFNMVAPPNSPWAAIDGDFGLEVSGYLSHIAHLPPGDLFPFRFYTHDPWWLNSPWFDRYDHSPHDIYLPLALARLDREGKVTPPAFLEFLTIDNSYGEMPDECPDEVTPHILQAMRDYSDQPGLLTWVYPFEEFHERIFSATPEPGGVFFSDWFMRNAVSAGLPVNTVVSTENLLSSRAAHPELYRDTVLLTPVPREGGSGERALLDHLEGGGKLFLYGSLTGAGAELLRLLNLKLATPLSGELEVRSTLPADTIRHGTPCTRLLHRDVLCDGGIEAVVSEPQAQDFEVCATVSDGASERVFAVSRRVGGGHLAWVRGSLSSTITHSALPQPHDPKQYFQAEFLMRAMLARFGYDLRLQKQTVETRTPLVLVARSNNGFFFSGYCPATTVTLRLRFPHGAPILHGLETLLEGGSSTYQMPRAWHVECRCFVEQAADGELACLERISEEIGIRRRVMLTGLSNATVHFYPELRPAGPPVRMETGQTERSFFSAKKQLEYSTEESGRRLVVRDVSGSLLISW